MKELHELVFLVDGKIVRLVRPQMADLSHDLAQFLARFVQLRQTIGFDEDLINGRGTPNVSQKFAWIGMIT